MFVNADFLDLSADLKVGSVIALNIAGRGFIPVAYVFHDDLVDETGLDGLANRLVIQTTRADPTFQSAIESRVLARLDQINMTVLGSQTTTPLKESSAAQMDILIVLLLATVVLSAVVGGLGRAITMSLNVMEGTREIGILRSLGAPNGVVRRLVVMEGLVVGLSSWAAAIPFSIPLGISLLARPRDSIFPMPAALIWLGLILLISMIASMIPAQSAARLTIRDALVYE
jgi:putative ABC transport system permease protein